MKHWLYIQGFALLLFTAPDIHAHNLATINGTKQAHQHVYQRQQYGKPLQQGHLVQTAGGSGTIMWGSGARSDYGKSTTPRSGPIIGDRKPKRRVKPRVKNKYGKAVNGYGKAVNGYGSSGGDG